MSDLYGLVDHLEVSVCQARGAGGDGDRSVSGVVQRDQLPCWRLRVPLAACSVDRASPIRQAHRVVR